MLSEVPALRLQVARQVAHWRAAVTALDDLENFAPQSAWASLERYLEVAVRSQLKGSVERLRRGIDVLEAEYRAAESVRELEQLRLRVLRFRTSYLQVSTALEFYGDAVASRTSTKMGELLRACDFLARRSMEYVLGPLGRPIPPVLTYIDTASIGASVLRAGLRLWDGRSFSLAAAIKIARHNLPRPTALLHEAGHQVSFSLGWHQELAQRFREELGAEDPEVGATLAGYASEIAGDAFAFAHAGYAAVAALHDVITGEGERVWRVPEGDPHPPARLRLLLGTVMARTTYASPGYLRGEAPWDDLERAWTIVHPIDEAPMAARAFHLRATPLLPRIADICLRRPMQAFGGRSLSSFVDPGRVRPDALTALAREAGSALFSSPHWLWTEALRLLALSGYRAATEPERAVEVANEFDGWMTRLGRSILSPAA